ncbi:hypothetical protein BGZ99_004900 [Dissophora globulifera]|uniref:histidine kinase n=1 Tax=Dissophora globulifera TaxID=979702 RepID=A0A9P6RGS2_9FUNG|nr:hypothetical protein BGZ99_004900 [Dissophora globulifera]
MVAQAPELTFPSVQELSLTLSADIEIHRLWKTITEILSQKFHATRITLCVPQDPTVVASSIENNLGQHRPWGLKAHWDSKHHFLDENTVTPKDEFVHHHHRLQKNAPLVQEQPDRPSLRSSVSALAVPSSSSSFSYSSSSSSSSSFSRKRAAHSKNNFSINLNYNGNNVNLNHNSNNHINGNTFADGDVHEATKLAEVYHKDYWRTNPALDGGYSSSSSSVSSYSSSDNPAMQGSRAGGRLRGFSLHSSGTECFANLQSLEYDPEPLLNEQTIDSILKAGKTVVLTREYSGSRGERRKSAQMRSFLATEDENDSSSYMDTDSADEGTDIGDVKVGGAESNRMARAIHIEVESSPEQDAGSDIDSSSSRYDSEGSYFPPVESDAYAVHNKSANFAASQPNVGYADFVQGFSPAWSQSPVLSPTSTKDDPSVNLIFFQPFKSYPTTDDRTFDPLNSSPESVNDHHSNSASEPFQDSVNRPRTSLRSQDSVPVSQLPPPSFVGNAQSLIHIPLYRSTDHNNQRYIPSDIQHHRPPAMPVGIISFLSDQTPYPQEALNVLTELNPFLANQITNALRLEDMIARSSRWGEIGSTSRLSEPSRASESFAQSIQRKMKDNYDVGTASIPGHLYSRSRPSSSRYASEASKDQNSTRAEQSSGTLGLSTDVSKGDLTASDPHRQPTAEINSHSERVVNSQSFEAMTMGTLKDLSPDDPQPSPFPLHLPDPERFEEDGRPSSGKQPESCYNLDSTTDEIHRSLNLLNLDVTGSATCPLAPQTKRMLGKQHHVPKNTQSTQIGNAFLSGWPNERRRTEPSLNLLDPEEPDGPDGMWQTLQTEETDECSSPVPNLCIGENEFESQGQESPCFSPVHSSSPSNAPPKRHLFSTNKRSGLRRRHKGVKDLSRSSATQLPPTESPLPDSPHTPSISGFSHLSEASSSSAGHSAPAFSPDPSPIASPAALQSGLFDQAFSSLDLGLGVEQGPYSKLRSRGHDRSREEAEGPRATLSRHGSGWSLNSDDTSLASPSLHQEKHHARRRHKKKHQAFASERSALNPFPRTRLLRLIVDAISHHVLVRRFDGQYRWFLGRILPVRDCGGHIVHWFGTSTDIHDQKLAELQLNRQIELELNEKKYRLLAEAIPQIVFTASPHIGLTFANAKWFTYSGQVFERACGLGFMDHVHPEDRAKCFLPTNISEGSGSPPATSEKGSRYSTSPGTAFGQGPGEVSYQTEMRLLRKDGKYRWFLVKCISVEVVEQGRKWFGTCTDINDQKLLEHKLKEAHDAAQKSTESKTRFLSNMSHDLTSEQLDYVHTVQQSADALLLVINDILDLSKVEAGMMKLEMEPFSVHNMIEGANELLSTLAIQKGLELGFLVEDDVPEVVVGDRVRLRQVLINIIGNAIKFTSQGEVFSRCSLVSPKPDADPDALTIRFEISDTGKGFDESERAVMFKPFSQVDTSSTRKHGGTGLGLVLSKEFVELHGGKIQCESVKGEGSKFSFTFVACVPPPNVAAKATTPIAYDEMRVSSLLRSHPRTATTQSSVLPTPPPSKHSGSRDSKKLSDLLPLKHITGLKLVPGAMCYAEPDVEDTRKVASKVMRMTNQKIERGDFASANTALDPVIGDDDDDDESGFTSESTVKGDSPQSDPATVMTRTESILDDRRYIKAGQVTPSNPPMGEPASVAIIAANLPNPAADMKLAIPTKVLETKALAAGSKKTASATSGIPLSNRPESPLPNRSSSPALSTLTDPCIDPKQSTPITMSSSGSLDGADAEGFIPEQPRILVIADFLHARETILHLIKQLIPKELNLLMDVATDLKQGIDFLVGVRRQATLSGKYNYLVINLPSYMSVMDIFSVLRQDGVLVMPNVMTCVITTPIQRAALMEAVKVEEASLEIAKLVTDHTKSKVIPDKVEWVFKPLTKAKLYVAFADIVAHHGKLGSQSGPGASGLDGSGDNGKMNVKRRTAQQVVVSQKEIFSQMHDAMEGKNIHILLAEDDLTNQKVIRRYFQKVGAELVIANDGNECLDKFKSFPRNHFSLILCDLFMPGKDGYEATRAVREWENEHLQEGERRIPIVALSANVMANVAEQCLSSGFTSYLSKPVDFKKLSETLMDLVL